MMNNDQLLEITTEIGWKLLKSGAEIYRVEESIRRMLAAYGFPEAEVFSKFGFTGRMYDGDCD